MSNQVNILRREVNRKRRDGDVVAGTAVGSYLGTSAFSSLLDNYLEVVNAGTVDEYLRCKLPFAGDYDVQAYTSGSQFPPTIWESMPLATINDIGGIILDAVDSVLFLRGDGVWAAASGGSMTYPAAGIPLSTSSAWGTSITNNSANWNAAYGWGNHSGLYTPIAHNTNTSNPHGVTASQVGLGSVTNESKATMFTNPTFTGTVLSGVMRAIHDAHAAGADDFNFEVFSNDTTDPAKYVSIRFHQSNEYYGQIRFNSSGFRLTAGNSDTLYPLTAGNIKLGTSTAFGYGNPLITVKNDANAPVSIAATNADAGSSASAALILSAYGNSWQVDAGSTAKNSNKLVWYLDSSNPVAKMSLTTGGELKVTGDIIAYASV